MSLPENHPLRVLVIGFGNNLRRDDGVGPAVVDCLAARISDPAVEFLPCHQLLPEHAEAASRAQRVIFIDAAADRPAGEITCRRVRPLTALKDIGHFFTPAGLLGIAEAVYGARPQAIVFAIGAESFDLGESLTPKVKEAAAKLCTRLVQRIPVWVRKQKMKNS